MSTRDNRTARIVGALYLLSNVTFLLGAFFFIEPNLATDALAQLSGSSSQVVLGAILELVNGLAYIGIAVLMFPLLRQRFESMALGYLALRVVEFVMQVLAVVFPLMLVSLSTQFAGTNTAEPSALAYLPALLVAGRNWAFQMLNIVFCLSALLFYTMLYQIRLVPRWISVWGVIGATLVLVATVLNWFGISLGTGLEIVTGLPMLFNELFLGVWLIVKGFSPEAEVAEPVQPALGMG